MHPAKLANFVINFYQDYMEIEYQRRYFCKITKWQVKLQNPIFPVSKSEMLLIFAVIRL